MTNGNLTKGSVRLVAFVWAISIFLVLPMVYAWEPTPKEIRQAASSGLPKLTGSIPEKDLRFYGFAKRSETERAQLREGIRVYTIQPQMLFAYKKGMDAKRMITPTDIWFFPVVTEGKSASLLTVDRMKGNWEAVAIGSSGLARQLETIESHFPPAGGYALYFVRVFQAQSDFMFIVKDKTLTIVPLESAIVGLNLRSQQNRYGNLTYTPEEIIPRLIPVVRENMRTQD